MATSKARARAALERDLHRHRDEPTPAPPSGWIRAIRDALGMSGRELALRMGLSQARVSQIEQGERERTITLGTLERAAEALGCRLEYVLVPHSPLEELVLEQARSKARAEIAAVDHTMALEDQGLTGDLTTAMIEEAARHRLDKRGLWS